MKDQTCSTCIHWKPEPVNPADLGAERQGQCRESPPQLTILPSAMGQTTHLFSYAHLPANFPGCDRHQAAADVPGPETQAGSRSNSLSPN